jgi:hypothetical protein
MFCLCALSLCVEYSLHLSTHVTLLWNEAPTLEKTRQSLLYVAVWSGAQKRFDAKTTRGARLGSRESRGTRILEWLRWQGLAALVNDST